MAFPPKLAQKGPHRTSLAACEGTGDIRDINMNWANKFPFIVNVTRKLGALNGFPDGKDRDFLITKHLVDPTL